MPRLYIRGVSTGVVLLVLLLGLYLFLLPPPEQKKIRDEVFGDPWRWSYRDVEATKAFSERWAGVLDRLGLGIEGSKRDSDGEEEGEGLDEEDRLVMVTAVSNNHFAEVWGMLETIQDLNGRPMVYIYDLGLTDDQSWVILRNFTDLVSLRKFNFTAYPEHVRNLEQYRWKPLIVAEVLSSTKHRTFWWFDSSVRIRNDRNLDWYLEDYVRRSADDPERLYPLVFTHYTSHSIFAATHPHTYEYFPVNETLSRGTKMFGATVFAVFRRHSIRRRIVRWWVLCALEEDCMAPKGSTTSCSFAPSGQRDLIHNGGCHRYDQSVLNILVAAANDFEESRYFRDKPRGAIQVERSGG